MLEIIKSVFALIYCDDFEEDSLYEVAFIASGHSTECPARAPPHRRYSL